ncbi:MAG TPA: hypothetical protein VF581_00935 [Flavobacterium sp.]|jgi:hypothetical protein
MKKILLVAALFLTISGYSKAVPSPSVFFGITEKILTGAHNFVFPEAKVTSKLRTEVKNKPQAAPKTNTALESVWNASFKLKRDGMWIISE